MTNPDDVVERRNAGPWLHIYAQPYWHEPAQIIGTRAALASLRDAINRCFETGGIAIADVFAIDGEGYSANIRIASHADLEDLPLPYTDPIARTSNANDIALIEQQRKTIEEFRDALSETLGDLCSQLEWETGLTDTEINERPAVIKSRALLQGDKKE